jgi:TRAP-type C4-dicarboxylate transport system substrate-binding protein
MIGATWRLIGATAEARMIGNLLRCVAAALALLPAVAAAEPIKLKLAFFSSDRNHLYRNLVKPFTDAVNAEGKGLVEIEVHLSGKLGADLRKQSRLPLDGAADFVAVVVPYEQAQFPDTYVVELPSLYRDAREASFAFTRLVAAGTIGGFDDFFVVGAVASDPETIHARPPVASLADLKGKRIRASNAVESAVMKALGMTPMSVPINEIAEAIGGGRLDGAYVPVLPMIAFGVGRIASNHYLLETSSVPLCLLMSRKRFDSLPGDVQAIIAKYSGEWLVQQFLQIDEAATALVMHQLESDSKRKVVLPSKPDMKTASAVFKSIVDDYAAGDPHDAALVDAARAEVAKQRSSH